MAIGEDPGAETAPYRCGLGRARATYIRRQPERLVLHQVVRQHLETFLAEARLRGGGAGMPRFVERELREFLSCGDMARGFARFRCGGCHKEVLVAFSCKGRGFCPSCCGRRMSALAAHLVDGVLTDLPVRQWVLTLPFRLRYVLAYDHRLCRAVLALFVRALLTFERRRACAIGVEGRGGAVTSIQRCGSALNTNVHFHTLVAEGVFVEQPNGPPRFVAAGRPPSDAEVGRLLVAIRRRILRLVRKHGIDLGREGEDSAGDRLAEESPTLAILRGAAVGGWAATGPRAGRRLVRLGTEPDAPGLRTAGPRQAHLEGFDLHADTAVRAGDERRLERLCRYVLRPPLAQHSLSWTAEGKVLLRLRRRWRDGTQAIRFEPSELLERLAAMVPRPRTNLLLYHGAFAPRGCRSTAEAIAAREEFRQAAVAQVEAPTQAKAGLAVAVPGPTDAVTAEASESETKASAPPTVEMQAQPRGPPVGGGYRRPRYHPWAELLKRTFGLDILACDACGGRLRLVATIAEPGLVTQILSHLGLPTEIPRAAPAQPLTWLPGLMSQDDWV